MVKISNKAKIMLVKAYILFCFLWGLLFLYVVWNIETGRHSDWNGLFWLIYFLWIIFAVLMIFLIKKVDINANQKLIKKNVLVNTYDDLKCKLIQKAADLGFVEFTSEKLFENTDSILVFKDMKQTTYVIQIIWIEEFDEAKLDEARRGLYKKLEVHIGKGLIEKRTIALLQFVCVPRMNIDFKKFISTIVFQDYKRYQYVVGISFGGRNAYICRCKGGLFLSQYNCLKKLFQKMTEGILGNK